MSGVSTEDQVLDVAQYVKDYIESTKALKENLVDCFCLGLLRSQLAKPHLIDG